MLGAEPSCRVQQMRSHERASGQDLRDRFGQVASGSIRRDLEGFQCRDRRANQSTKVSHSLSLSLTVEFLISQSLFIYLFLRALLNFTKPLMELVEKIASKLDDVFPYPYGDELRGMCLFLHRTLIII